MPILATLGKKHPTQICHPDKTSHAILTHWTKHATFPLRMCI